MSRKSSTHLSMRVCFADGRHIDDSKISLLEAIRTHGSMLAAAKAISMSYRHAWLLMDELDRMFEQKVIITHPGRRGAGTEVTAFGERLIALYRAMEQRANRSNKATLDEITAALSVPSEQDEEPEARVQAG
ncbi:MAG: winged helix-turn-helix domain-containing protein [Xanthobacter sp.]